MNTTWDLSLLFSSDDDPKIEKALVRIEKEANAFVKTWKHRLDFLEKPRVLRKALDEYELLSRQYGTSGSPGYYFFLRESLDQASTDIKAKLAKVDDFSTKIGNLLQFFELRLAKVPVKTQTKLLKHTSLAPYKHYLERIFKLSSIVLSEPEERIVHLYSDPAYAKWTQMLSTFLSKEEREVFGEDNKRSKKNLEQLISLTASSRKNVRDRAANAINDILKKHVESAEAEINAVLATKKIGDELRGIKRPDYTRHLSDDIDSEVVDTLLTSVSSRFDISARFYKLKANVFGVKKLAYHERNVEIGTIDKTYPFDEAVSLVSKVFNRLDQEFGHILKGYIKNGQLDVYPQKGKRGGAFCAHWLMSQPTYILLNYTDKLRDMTTLAHEMGHGINNELIKKKQHALDFGTPMATAEVASTFMEDFVLEELIKTSDEETTFAILMTKLNDDISTIFRQAACYQFEQELHAAFREKGYLSYREIGSIFQTHMSSYMGEGVEQSEGSENWWVHWHHIRAYFYVYSYASGLLISKSLQNSVKNDPKFIAKVKDFLSTGLSDSPKNIFMTMNIDIADSKFWDKGLKEIENLLDKTELLAKKLGKIK